MLLVWNEVKSSVEQTESNIVTSSGKRGKNEGIRCGRFDIAIPRFYQHLGGNGKQKGK